MLITLMHWPPRRRSNRTGSRTAPQPFLNDTQWFLIADLFPDPPVSRKGGRPRVAPRACLEGILWVLRSGARWKDLPERYPSPATCWRRHRDWVDAGIFEAVWGRLLGRLEGFQKLNWEEAIGDGTPTRQSAPLYHCKLPRPATDAVPAG